MQPFNFHYRLCATDGLYIQYNIRNYFSPELFIMSRVLIWTRSVIAVNVLAP